MIEIPMSEEMFQAKSAELKQKHGLELPGSEGTIAKDGLKAHYRHAAGVLTVSITERPPFLSETFAETQLRKFLSA